MHLPRRSGSADLSALTEGLPADLLIDPAKAAAELLKIANDKKRSTMVQVGPAGTTTCCPPRHRMPFNSRNEGSKCVG